jgi:hypothetical protein
MRAAPRFFLSVLAVVAALASANPVEAYSSTSAKAWAAPIMSSPDVSALFADKTWSWGNGSAGYFSPKHRFVGIATGQGYKSWGQGIWFVFNGRLCIKARWHTGYLSSLKQECFSHRQEGAVVYQQKANGSWYVFSGGRPGRWEGASNLKPGNQIEAEFEARKHRKF